MALTKDDLLAIGELMDNKLEPINDRLDVMQGDINILKEDVAVLKEDVGVLKEDVISLKSEMVEVKNRVTGIEIQLENKVYPYLQTLSEGQDALNAKISRLEDLPEKVNDLQMTTENLVHAFQQHVQYMH